MAQAFGVIPVSVWRWARALAGGGVAGLVPAAKGPQRASVDASRLVIVELT